MNLPCETQSGPPDSPAIKAPAQEIKNFSQGVSTKDTRIPEE